MQNKENYNNATFGEPRVKNDSSWSISFFNGSSTTASTNMSKSYLGGGTASASDNLNVSRPGASQQFYYYYADIYILVEAIDNYENLQALRKMYNVWTTVKQRGPRSKFDLTQLDAGLPTSPEMKETAGQLPDDKPSSPESLNLMDKFDHQSEVTFEDIMNSLNGFARIIKYRSCP